MSDAIEYSKRLVAVPSVSAQSNQPVSEVVAAILDEIGFQVEVQEFADPAGIIKSNVVGKRGSGRGGVAYFGHTDVVPVTSWSVKEHGPFEPTIREDRLYGRGSCDMKGSVACMLAAAAQIASQSLNEPLYVVCTADEEVGFHGARHLVNHSPFYREIVEGQSRGIIGEPTELKIVHAHKGIYGFRVVSHGRAAHSSTREGKNANLAMIPFLMQMRQIYDETMTDKKWLNDEFDPPSISWNIGINDHTSAVNITAPQSVCTVYFRPAPGQEPMQLVERAKKAAAELGLDFQLECSGRPLYANPKSEYIQESLKLANQQDSLAVSYGTDGVMFTELQQILVCGPGSIRQAHTDDEWIALEQLKQGTDLFGQMIRRWCVL